MRKMSVVSVFVILALAACGTPASPPTPTAPLPTATPVPPTPTPIPPTPTPTPGIVVEGTELDIAIIGDSSMWGVGPFYAALVEKDLNVPVKVDQRALPGQAIGGVLELLRTNPYWRTAFPEREIVVFFGNPEKSESTAHPGDWCCVSRPYYVNDCSPESFDVYKEHVDGVIEEILALRGGKATVIIATDTYNPLVSEWKEAGVEQACTRCFENMTASIRQSAEEHGILFVSRYDAFNGPNHDQDPREKGYIGVDGVHCSEAGQEFIAQLLRTAGYQSVTR